MNRVFFENVRCFGARQTVPLAPLTVLVGENSSGKSTFLALVRLAWDLTAHLRTPDFNEEPFLLGAYEQVAAFGSAQAPFVIGTEVTGSSEEAAVITGAFVSRSGQPALAKLSWDLPPYSLSVSFENSDRVGGLDIDAPSGRVQIQQPHLLQDTRGLFTAIALFGHIENPAGGVLKGSLSDQKDFMRIGTRLYRAQEHLKERPYAFAPIRTRPQRTYDPIKGLESPEGSHIPMVLASTLLREPSEWKELIEALDSFGRQSGLFGKVEVRRLGSSEGDPFQIQVHVGGKAVNVIDVGYGVSQVLPIIIDSLRGKRGGTFLLQQPEVHLHPKAQAELGSFLGTLVKQQDKRFIIETHSDYLVDRIRMDIRDRKGLQPQDVALLYFERCNGEARIHRLELDEHGNIIDAPPGYRSFFLEEERRFLGG